ncbi:MAG: CCA tRNA nucleotidyltransferase [Clostridiales bacterium]|nr:CCA tRNA nucleotidyltransferase [Clostridiales bacterium]
MRRILPKNLLSLADSLSTPLYAVGGSVRDFLAGLTPSTHDWDICSPLSADEFSKAAAALGFNVTAVYRNTGTVKLKDIEGVDYEYSSFRSDTYVRGVHVPVAIHFTDDIALDARRRDFTANAVYFDIRRGEFADPLNGIAAISEKRLTTVAPAKKVFGEDGLRLMRLARQAAQLGFFPDKDCLAGAKANAALIKDISPERILTELNAILTADKKYGVQDGHYHGLKLLDETGVLAYILPELAQGKGLTQRADFHKYDVLEHSLRAARYAPAPLRLAALLHDVGKPLCMLRDGNAHEHPVEGVRLATDILHRLKAPKKETQKILFLIQWHMYDFNCQTKESKLRRFFVSNANRLDDLLALKQADFSACTDDFSPAPTCVRWKALLKRMENENVPFSLKTLAIKGDDLLTLGVAPARIATILQRLLTHTAVEPKDNKKEKLLRLALVFEKELF